MALYDLALEVTASLPPHFRGCSLTKVTPSSVGEDVDPHLLLAERSNNLWACFKATTIFLPKNKTMATTQPAHQEKIINQHLGVYIYEYFLVLIFIKMG